MNEKVRNENSKLILAFVLIGIGLIWAFRRLDIHINFLHILPQNIAYSVGRIFHEFFHFVFSWPIILIVVGLLLVAGKRKFGIALIVLGGIFIFPRIFFHPGLTLSLVIPILLVGIGLALIVRKT